MSSLRTVGRNLSWLTAGEVLLKAQLLLAAVLVGRGLGAAELGIFTVAYFAGLVFVQVLCLGQIEVLIREIARRPERARGLLRLAVSIVGRWAAVLLPVVLLLLLLLEDGALRRMMLALLPWVLLRAAIILLGAAFKGLDRMDVEIRARVVEMGVALPLFLGVAMVAAPVWWTGLALGLGAATGLAWLAGRVIGLPRTISGLPRRFLLSEGVPFLALGLVGQLTMRTDAFLLAALGRTQEEIGFYGAAAMPVWGLLGMAYLISLALYPTLARRAAEGGAGARSVAALAGLGVLVGGGAAALLWGFREPLVGLLFGGEFGETVHLLGVLAWVLPGASAMMILGAVFAAWNRQRWALGLQVLVLLLAVGLLVAWIPLWGPWGAAAAVVVSHTAGGVAVVLLALALSGRRLEAQP